MSRRPAADRLVRHSETRIVVIDELRIAFLPIPKSGCTSLLWTLADLAGLAPERFGSSRQAEVTPQMAIHDMTRWEPRHRWQERSAAQRHRILSDPGWLRLSVVRDPAPRLWSGWQSKLLLAEPRFVDRFGSEPWFPDRVDTPEALRTSFHAFVRALDVDPELAPHDAHWGPQTGLMAGFDPTWVGRAEDPGRTLQVLRDHVAGVGADPGRVRSDVPRENANPIPYHPTIWDPETALAVARIFASDYAAWDYVPPQGATAADPSLSEEQCQALAADRLGAVAMLAERHRRIGELLAVGADLERAAAHQRRRAEEAESELATVTGSRSWRATEPLRRLRARSR
ncbi:sulfotransferase family 2 domain-containing protein [Nocardioides insulae]|uniref:sulfotransferase family 2 domain-containing protein n=1 Tax=Nocardioides insulae TaxID=394734 RepID=UPI0003F8A5B0|nr:sulfotransferase family 2 domain-containing protein [Nocardioides insulae]